MNIEVGKTYKTWKGLAKIHHTNGHIVHYSLPDDDKIYKILAGNLFYTPFEMLQRLTGNIENGTDGILTIFQDDSTKDWCIKFRFPYSDKDAWEEWDNTFKNVIFKAFQKHGE